jgi:hypothetical protein
MERDPHTSPAQLPENITMGDQAHQEDEMNERYTFVTQALDQLILEAIADAELRH